MPHDVTFKYLRIHLPTKETWECEYPKSYSSSKEEFLDHLVRWNKMDPNKWLYAPIEA